MPEGNVQVKKEAQAAKRLSQRAWALAWVQRLWRPAGTLIAVVLALLITWHAIYGNHGLSVWLQKRAQDRALQREIKNLQQENADMRQQILRLQSDPDAIEREAREKLHYAKPGEVIYTLPDQPQQPKQTQPGK
ncbi:MAG: septum formation initiator family protein [Terracidiphilus sp.]|jgi:cell division protein FtsB